jgi:hypothetical protein
MSTDTRLLAVPGTSDYSTADGRYYARRTHATDVTSDGYRISDTKRPAEHGYGERFAATREQAQSMVDQMAASIDPTDVRRVRLDALAARFRSIGAASRAAAANDDADSGADERSEAQNAIGNELAARRLTNLLRMLVAEEAARDSLESLLRTPNEDLSVSYDIAEAARRVADMATQIEGFIDGHRQHQIFTRMGRAEAE